MSKSKKPTIKDLQREISAIGHMVNALNTACVAIAYAAKVKGNELDKIKPEDYVDFVTKRVHPLVKRADTIAEEYATKKAEELKAAAKEEKK